MLDEHRLFQLRQYAEILLREGVRVGAISVRDGNDIWERHILDSLRSLACFAGEWLDIFDLGSGGGLPGIPVAIARPDARISLIESRARRAAFLEYAVETLAIPNARVILARCEAVEETADVCLARAFAPPVRSWELAAPLLRPRGALLYFAGRSWGATEDMSELAELGVTWRICVPAEFPWQGPIVMMTGKGMEARP